MRCLSRAARFRRAGRWRARRALAERVEEAGAGPGGDLPDAGPAGPAEDGYLKARMRDVAACQEGVPDQVITEAPGHPETGVTMNTCAHVLPALRQEAADAIDDLSGA